MVVSDLSVGTVQVSDLSPANADVACRNVDELADVSVVEQRPDMEGRTMLMVLAPIPKKKSGSKEVASSAKDQNPQINLQALPAAGKGKLMRTKQGKSHLRRRTSKRTKVQLSEMHEVQGRG
jgi:large subunit ribosomal protein L35